MQEEELRDFFEKVRSLINSKQQKKPAVVTDEKSRTIWDFLLKLPDFSVYTEKTIRQYVDELCRRKYTDWDFRRGRVTGIIFLIDRWPGTEPDIVKQNRERRYAVFMDYLNLERNLGTQRFDDFSWLIDPIRKEGIIIFGWVFIPQSYIGNPAIHQLSNIHSFDPILCTQQMQGVVTKDKDRVDAKMDSLARRLIDHSDITDIVIISGDADFQDLANYARWRNKEVKIISAKQAISSRFIKMAGVGAVKMELHE